MCDSLSISPCARSTPHHGLNYGLIVVIQSVSHPAGFARHHVYRSFWPQLSVAPIVDLVISILAHDYYFQLVALIGEEAVGSRMRMHLYNMGLRIQVRCAKPGEQQTTFCNTLRNNLLSFFWRGFSEG